MKIFLSRSELDKNHPGYVKPFYLYKDYYPEDSLTSNVVGNSKEEKVLLLLKNQFRRRVELRVLQIRIERRRIALTTLPVLKYQK